MTEQATHLTEHAFRAIAATPVLEQLHTYTPHHELLAAVVTQGDHTHHKQTSVFSAQTTNCLDYNISA